MVRTSWRSLVLPSPLEAITYLLVSLFVFTGINIALVIYRVSGAMISSDVQSGDYLGILGGLTRIPVASTAVIVIFWSGVGLIAYTIVWAIINAVIEARNEIVVESEYANKGSLFDRLTAPLLKSGFLILLLVLLGLNRWWLVPMLLRSFHQTLSSGKGIALVTLVIPVLLGALDMALCFILYRVAFNSTELVEQLKQAQNTPQN